MGFQETGAPPQTISWWTGEFFFSHNFVLNDWECFFHQVGQFGFGSSIVLVFEAPEGLQFPTKEMETVKYGQHLL